MGHLQEAVLARLTRGGDLGPDEAPAASDRLMKSIQQESILPGPTKIDRNVLSAWVGAPERTVLQSKPSLDEDTVHRGELLDNLAMVLRRESVVVAYGLPKTGKTQFISALVDHAGSSELYFWFTFSGESGDLDRLMKQLCIWFGQKTSVWQTKADVEAGRLQPAQLFDRLSKVPVDGAWIVFDDCHKSKDRNLFETIRNSIVKAWPNCRMILISEEKLPEMPDTYAITC